jgi:hypothetical protein
VGISRYTCQRAAGKQGWRFGWSGCYSKGWGKGVS